MAIIKKVISLIIATVMLVPSIVTQSIEQGEKDKISQGERLIKLSSIYDNEKAPKVDEDIFFDGDLKKELNNGLKFNELSFIATHNSYQTKSSPAYRQVFKNLSTLTFGLVSDKNGEFYNQTLTEQFNCGIRSIEIDIETVKKGDSVSFTCMHSPVLDMGTTCYDLGLALQEIKMWSDYNPNHLPITIIIEPKKVFVPLENMKYFNLDYAMELEKLLRYNLGDKLFTPADMLGNYSSFAQMRENDDWCEVKNMLGKVLVLLHDTSITQDYINIDKTIKTQAMFPMLRYDDKDLSYSSFLLINEPQEALECKQEIIIDKKFVVRTRVDTYTSVSVEDFENSISSGAQILSTDYPVKSDSQQDDYCVSFGNKKTVSISK